jgi:hypothetical protein
LIAAVKSGRTAKPPLSYRDIVCACRKKALLSFDDSSTARVQTAVKSYYNNHIKDQPREEEAEGDFEGSFSE